MYVCMLWCGVGFGAQVPFTQLRDELERCHLGGPCCPSTRGTKALNLVQLASVALKYVVLRPNGRIPGDIGALFVDHHQCTASLPFAG